MRTETLTNNMYEVPEANNQQIENVLYTIQKNRESHESVELHPSVIDAQVKQMLFLGRLKRLNKDIEHESKRLNFLLRDVISLMLDKPAEEGIDLNEYLENVDVDVEESVITGVNGILDKYLSKSVGERFTKSVEGQLDERLGLWNHKHYMTRMTRATGDLFSSEERLEARHTNSIGTIFFDLDGLKAINDRGLGGYESGDRALQAMADALKNKELYIWAARQGIELIPTHHHGDEFLLGIIGEKNIDLTVVHDNFNGVDGGKMEKISLIKYIGEYINKTIEKSPVDKILDFSNPKQLEKFKDLKDDLPKGVELDKEFKYKLSCSYGYTTLRDGIARSVEDKFDFGGNKPNGGKVDWEYSIFRLVGKGLIGTSEDKLKISKAQGREKRANSENPNDRLLERLYRFGRELDDKEELLEIIKELQKFAKKREREANIVKRRMTGLGNVVSHNATMSAQIQKEQTEVRAMIMAKKDAEILEKDGNIDSLEKELRADRAQLRISQEHLAQLMSETYGGSRSKRIAANATLDKK